jgi:shikimate 5-dehydrogenase
MDPAARPPLTVSSRLLPAEKPTMYFLGVTTDQSSIVRVFPRWAEYLGLHDVLLQGVNFSRHEALPHYRRLIEFIKHDPLSLGALVTTHKLDVLDACRDLFEELDEHAVRLSEVSSISKRNGRLVGHAKDPITSGLALQSFLAPDYWLQTGAEALVLGAGGSAVAITWHLLQRHLGSNRPARLLVTNRSEPRLTALERFHSAIGVDIPVEYHLTSTTSAADKLLAGLKSGSLIINATGLGKDAPGSPLSDAANWPRCSIAWDFNYRGDLRFLRQAQSQAAAKRLRVEDGWVYFILGWTQVMAEVFRLPIATEGPQFDDLSRIAAAYR